MYLDAMTLRFYIFQAKQVSLVWWEVWVTIIITTKLSRRYVLKVYILLGIVKRSILSCTSTVEFNIEFLAH